MKIAIIGSTLSGNKGAASMLEASIQTITSKDPKATFSVFTVYPDEDEKFNTYKNVKLFSAKPLFLGAILNPLTLLYKILPPLRPLLRRQKHVKALAEADVLLDEGGITFVDGRAKFLIYNVATILPGIMTNTRVVKCSQAMGPFNTWINKFVAKLLLPRVDTICARGALTYKYLKILGLKNVIESTDYAFLMDVSTEEAKQAEQVIKRSGSKFGSKEKTIVVMPSEVIRKKAEKNGEDYVRYNRDFIKYLLGRDYKVLLLAYSARKDRDSRHNNDLPVCRDIASDIDNGNFTFVDEELSAQQLRHIIGKADIAVTSRFHAMIAALTMATPPLVIGWSHKYAEIMDMFGLKESALDSKNLDHKALQVAFESVSKDRQKIRTAIKKHLPAVKKSANRQVDTIVSKP